MVSSPPQKPSTQLLPRHCDVAVQATPRPRLPPQYPFEQPPPMHWVLLVHAEPTMRRAPEPQTRTPPPAVEVVAEQQFVEHSAAVPQGAPSTWQRVISRRLPVTSNAAPSAPNVA
jgi:hypothetical protein